MNIHDTESTVVLYYMYRCLGKKIAVNMYITNELVQ